MKAGSTKQGKDWQILEVEKRAGVLKGSRKIVWLFLWLFVLALN
jgi:hypothetical protein